jgi:hypothetical protein
LVTGLLAVAFQDQNIRVSNDYGSLQQIEILNIENCESPIKKNAFMEKRNDAKESLDIWDQSMNVQAK